MLEILQTNLNAQDSTAPTTTKKNYQNVNNVEELF
jgi:hypothetical protein